MTVSQNQQEGKFPSLTELLKAKYSDTEVTELSPLLIGLSDLALEGIYLNLRFANPSFAELKSELANAPYKTLCDLLDECDKELHKPAEPAPLEERHLLPKTPPIYYNFNKSHDLDELFNSDTLKNLKECRTKVKKVWADPNGHKEPIFNECGERACSRDAYEATFRKYKKVVNSIPDIDEGKWFELTILADGLPKTKKGKPVPPKFEGDIIQFHHIWNDDNPIQPLEHFHILIRGPNIPKGAKEIKRKSFHFQLFTLSIRNPFMLIKVTKIANNKVTYSVLSAPLLNAEKSKAIFTVALPDFKKIFELADKMKYLHIYQLKGNLKGRDEFETLRVDHAAGKPLSNCEEKNQILNSQVDELIYWESEIEKAGNSEERKACRKEINLLKKHIKRYLYKKVCDICGALMDQRPATQEEQIQLAPSIPET